MKGHSSAASFRRRANRARERSDPVVTHYPASVFHGSASSSSVDLHVGPARKTISTPILQASGDNIGTRKSDRTRSGIGVDRIKTGSTAKRNDVPLKQSSSFVATNSELPIIDISAFDYHAYRYKLIEAALRKQYDDYQPPGDVVLNSIHLNDNDSVVAVRLNDRYHHSLFDFVEEYYDATIGMSKRETEYLHPLDHFLVKGTQRPETVERETETRRVDVADFSGQDDRSPRISFYDDTVVANGSMRRRESIMKKSSKSSKPRPSSAGADSTTSRRSTFARSAGRKSATKFSRTASSIDSASSKGDTLSGSQKRDDRRETISSVDEGERESMNCTTISSIDSESVRSESSKYRDDRSCHSRDSSVASKRCTADKPRVQPWLTGNPRVSFNRKYGNASNASSKMFEASRRSSSTRRPSVPSKHDAGKQSDREDLEHASRVPASLSPSNGIDEKDGLGSTSIARTAETRNDRPVRLEAIKSETEEPLKSDPLSSMNDLSARRRNNDSTSTRLCRSTKFSSPGVRVPETIDSFVEIAQQPPGEPRLTGNRSKEAREGTRTGDEGSKAREWSGKSWKLSRSEKFAKLCRDKRQRSRTVGPVSARRATLSPRTKLSRETLPTRREDRENGPLNACKSNEDRKVVNEGTRTLEDRGKKRENRRSKIESDSKSSPYGKRRSPEFNGREEEEKRSVTLTPRLESSKETLRTRDELRENDPKNLNTSNGDEDRKEMNESTKILGEDANKKQENRRLRAESNSRSSCYAKRKSPESRRKEDGRTSVQKTSEETCRGKAIVGKNILGSTTITKDRFSTNAKPSLDSRSLQQRTIGARANIGLHDNAIAPRSMQIGSSKSPIGERKTPFGERAEKGEGNRRRMKESGPDGLKLPRRDSKAGIVMQAGLKKYIKKLKRVLSDRDNADIGELASLSLTDAILPDLESNLSSVEVQQVQNLLNMAERKSELMQKELLMGNAL